MRPEHGSSASHIATRLFTQADFSYSMELDLIKIVDLNRGSDLSLMYRECPPQGLGLAPGFNLRLYRNLPWREPVAGTGSIGMTNMSGSSQSGRACPENPAWLPLIRFGYEYKTNSTKEKR
jgi:hypothetical protein